MGKQGLLLTNFSNGVSGGSTPISFEFDYYDNDVRQTYYMFRSYSDPLTTSKNWQDLQSTISQGPQTIGDIPDRENDAVLMTMSDATVTWALQTFPVRLILGGILVWDWKVTFEIPVFPFRLDGTWTQH